MTHAALLADLDRLLGALQPWHLELYQDLHRHPELSFAEVRTAGLVADRGTAPTPFIVGFAAETGDDSGDVIEHARAKLTRKGCDLLVVNAVGNGGDGRHSAFEVEDNEGWLLGADGSSTALPHSSKAALAARVWDAVAARLR